MISFYFICDVNFSTVFQFAMSRPCCGLVEIPAQDLWMQLKSWFQLLIPLKFMDFTFPMQRSHLFSGVPMLLCCYCWEAKEQNHEHVEVAVVDSNFSILAQFSFFILYYMCWHPIMLDMFKTWHFNTSLRYYQTPFKVNVFCSFMDLLQAIKILTLFCVRIAIQRESISISEQLKHI